ncbi:MAG TPA: hypothetical protein VES95_00645 [Dermatophilaceae bacterium]|nr:hypothetical protein [Dermatophilaceae bacterium]
MNQTTHARSSRRATRRVLAVGAGLTLAGALGVGTASASPDVTTTVTHSTFRLVDEQNHILSSSTSRGPTCAPPSAWSSSRR